MRTLLLTLTAVLAMGQEFEVATIRPAGPLNAQAVQQGKLILGQRITGNQVDFGFASLRNLIVMAYELKPHQVSAPDWMDEQRYDIHALMPEGADSKQVPAMLRVLLKERFGLTVTRATRELDVYAMDVARDGHKMKVAPEAAPAPALDPAKPVPGERTLEISGQQMRVNQQPIAGGGTNLSIAGADGSRKISMTPDGRMHLEVERFTMQQLADTLTGIVELPVIDHTNLDGSYQVALDLTMADILRLSSPILGKSAVAGAQAALAGRGAAMEPGTDVIGAVQKLGLRLTKQKAPIEVLVVESANRTPTEN